MTKFKVGDKIGSGAAGDWNGTTTITKIEEGNLYGYWENKYSKGKPKDYEGFMPAHLCYLIKSDNKKKIGDTIINSTGTITRKIIFIDETGALVERENSPPGVQKRVWLNSKVLGGYTLLPPEEWVNLYRRSDNVICVSGVVHSSEQKALEGMSNDKSIKWIKTVRVDENNNPSSV